MRAWVGCWPQPSPALTTAAWVCRAARRAAPTEGCRITIASAPKASRVTTVSRRASPFCIALPFSEIEITSAPARRAASSNETTVRVDASKKARQTVLPARECPARPAACSRARSRISFSSSLSMPSRVRKFLACNADHPVLAIGFAEAHAHCLLTRGWDVLADIIGSDGQFPVPAVHEDGEAYRRGAPELQKGVHRRPRRPPGVEYVVHEHHRLSGHIERNMAPPHPGVLTPHLSVVPVQGDVQSSHRDLQTLEMLDVLRDSFCQRRPAGEHAHQGEAVERRGVAFEDLMRDAPQGTIHTVFGEDLGEGWGFGAASQRSEGMRLSNSSALPVTGWTRARRSAWSHRRRPGTGLP